MSSSLQLRRRRNEFVVVHRRVRRSHGGVSDESHGRAGILRLALGSVSDKVVQKSRCSVLVVRPKSYDLSETPEIEPACADCVAKQAETRGELPWCARHGRTILLPIFITSFRSLSRSGQRS